MGFMLMEYVFILFEIIGEDIGFLDMDESVYREVFIKVGLFEGMVVVLVDLEYYVVLGWF